MEVSTRWLRPKVARRSLQSQQVSFRSSHETSLDCVLALYTPPVLIQYGLRSVLLKLQVVPLT
jgi:hypothetical protein